MNIYEMRRKVVMGNSSDIQKRRKRSNGVAPDKYGFNNIETTIWLLFV